VKLSVQHGPRSRRVAAPTPASRHLLQPCSLNCGSAVACFKRVSIAVTQWRNLRNSLFAGLPRAGALP